MTESLSESLARSLSGKINAYVGEPRMSQDIDLVSTRAAELAEELRDYLSERFHIAVRVPVIGADKGYRLFQIQKPRNRNG